MSGSGRAGSGRGNNRHRTEGRNSFRRRDKNYEAGQDGQNRGGPRRGGENSRREKEPFFDRPKWVPPKINTDPLPVPTCPWCGKPIRDISQAIADKDSGEPVHFDCVAARITGGEKLERGEAVTYIGGGRFGVVCFTGQVNPRGPQDRNSGPPSHDFKIKKIIEWENKEKRAEWRSVICDHYSVT